MFRLLTKNRLLITLLFISQFSFAQEYLLLTNEQLLPFEKAINNPAANFHSSIKPYNKSDINKIIGVDSVFATKTIVNPTPKSITISPIITSTVGRGKEPSNVLFANGNIGGTITANYKNKLAVNAYYFSGNVKYPSYIQRKIDETNIVPGLGYAHSNTFNTINYRNWGGYVSYSPSKLFNFTLGHGKNFFGNGYRSLLLSDAANNYSYFKITTTIGKFKYVQLYANFKDISATTYTDYYSMPNKFGSFHYLSWNIARWLNISFFETVIWPGKDGSLQRSFDINYLNPVAFYRPVEYSIGSSDNSLMGLNLQLKISKKQQFYGQLMLDEFLLSSIKTTINHHWLRNQAATQWGWWANKQAIQFGYRWFDSFFIKNLNWRLEYNFVPPYTYAHTGGLLNYGHENQPLAHPSGANFHELISILNFQHNHWYVELKNMYQLIGKDTGNTNYGSNIYLDYQTYNQQYQNYAGQGLTSIILLNQFKIGYVLHPASNLVLEIGVLNRSENNATSPNSTTIIFGGIKTSLSNIYKDF